MEELDAVIKDLQVAVAECVASFTKKSYIDWMVEPGSLVRRVCY